MSQKNFHWPVIGHHNIVSYLQQSIVNNQVSHAYLFFGPSQVGKTTVVKSFVNSLVCDNTVKNQDPIPCQKCPCCQQINNNIHPDVLMIEKAVDEKTGKEKKNISIEQIRELQNRLNLHSFLNSYKIAIINGAEALSQEAANSLLKILEEPSPKTVIILIANSLSMLPKTIISRCQTLKFSAVSDEEIFKYFIELGEPRKKATALTASAYGRPGIALTYLAQPEIFDDYREKIKNFLALHKLSSSDRFKKVSELVNASETFGLEDVLSIWTRAARDLILVKNLGETAVNNSSFASELDGLAKAYTNRGLVKILSDIKTAKLYLQANVSPRLVLENLVLNLPTSN